MKYIKYYSNKSEIDTSKKYEGPLTIVAGDSPKPIIENLGDGVKFTIDVTNQGIKRNIDMSTVTLQNKNVIPSCITITVKPDMPYLGLNQVSVNNIDASIDNNIQSSNIKKGINIMSVSGSYDNLLNLYLIGENSFFNNISIYSDKKIKSLNFFKNWKNLKKITLDNCSEVTNRPWDGYQPPIEEIYLPNCTKIYNKEDFSFEGVFMFLDTLKKFYAPKCSYIDSRAFAYCRSLSEVSFPNCSYIGEEAFTECTALPSKNGCRYAGDNILTLCLDSTITSYSDSNVTFITGDYAFANCRSLSLVSFPNCSCIGYAAFYSCSSLTSVSFPNCSYISENAFAHCNSLTTVSFPNCSYIGNYAFSNCTKLSSVSFPNCSYISGNAFKGCTALPSKNGCRYMNDTWSVLTKCLDSTITSYSDSNVTIIGGDYAFNSCYSLTSVSFPNCSYIGNYAFSNCTKLSSVSFPNCTYVGYYAFFNCRSLSSVSFPNCSYIGGYAFDHCISLTTVSFPNCSDIGLCAFSNCSSLSLVSFPNCSCIGYAAFWGCTSLSQIYINKYSSICTLEDTAVFANTPFASGIGSIYVPSTLVESYKSATNWVYFSSCITAYQE